MRERTNLHMNQKGVVSFLFLAVIAIFLIGFVGYVSVKRLKTNTAGQEIVSNKTSSVLAADTSSDELSEDELDDEVMELEKVDDSLDTGIPEVDSSIKVDTQDDSMMTEDTSRVSEEKMMTVKMAKRVKLLGLIPFDAEITVEKDSATGEETITDQPFYLKFLSFLFTSE